MDRCVCQTSDTIGLALPAVKIRFTVCSSILAICARASSSRFGSSSGLVHALAVQTADHVTVLKTVDNALIRIPLHVACVRFGLCDLLHVFSQRHELCCNSAADQVLTVALPMNCA